MGVQCFVLLEGSKETETTGARPERRAHPGSRTSPLSDGCRRCAGSPAGQGLPAAWVSAQCPAPALGIHFILQLVFPQRLPVPPSWFKAAAAPPRKAAEGVGHCSLGVTLHGEAGPPSLVLALVGWRGWGLCQLWMEELGEQETERYLLRKSDKSQL